MPTIGAPLQGYYYDVGTDTLRPIAGTPGLQGATGPSQLCVAFVGDATANVTLTSMAAAADYFNTSVRYATKLDLLNYTQSRLVVRKMATAGAASASIFIGFSTTNPASVFSTPAWTSSGATCVLNTTNTTLDSGWINMPAGMIANDMHICPLQSSGDGSASPVVGGVWAFFRNPNAVYGDTRGIIGYAEQTVQQTGITTAMTDLTGLSIPFTAVAGRRYKMSLTGMMSQNTSAGIVALDMTDGSNNRFLAEAMNIAAGGFGTFSGSVVKTLTAGPITVKLRANTSAGTLITNVSPTAPFTLLVEDIG